MRVVWSGNCGYSAIVMDTIFIRGLRFNGKHGVDKAEREIPQEFQVEVEIVFDTRTAARSDELPNTIDYVPLRDIVQRVIEGPSKRLIETLAQNIADNILKDVRVRQVKVTVQKTKMFATGVPGVTIVRGRTHSTLASA